MGGQDAEVQVQVQAGHHHHPQLLDHDGGHLAGVHPEASLASRWAPAPSRSSATWREKLACAQGPRENHIGARCLSKVKSCSGLRSRSTTICADLVRKGGSPQSAHLLCGPNFDKKQVPDWEAPSPLLCGSSVKMTMEKILPKVLKWCFGLKRLKMLNKNNWIFVQEKLRVRGGSFLPPLCGPNLQSSIRVAPLQWYSLKHSAMLLGIVLSTWGTVFIKDLHSWHKSVRVWLCWAWSQVWLT